MKDKDIVEKILNENETLKKDRTIAGIDTLSPETTKGVGRLGGYPPCSSDISPPQNQIHFSEILEHSQTLFF